MSYDVKFRKRALEYLEDHKFRETAEIFGVTTRTLSKWKRQYILTGNLEPSPAKTRLSKIDPDKLKQYVSEHPDAFQYEIAKEFDCTQQAIHLALKRIGFTRKKRVKDIKNSVRSK